MRFEFSSGIVVYSYFDNVRKFLFLKRKEGFLDLPKGHIEKEEHALEAAIREAREETGLDLTPRDNFVHKQEYWYMLKDEKVKKRVTMFLAMAKPGQNVRISNEHTGFVWLSLEEAREKLSFKNQVELITMANEYIDKLEETGIESFKA